MTKTIGIIGGMGPAATIDLLTKIYANSTAKCDQGHVRVLADIDPSIPDRTEAIINNNGEQVTAHLLKNARGLIAQGAQLLAMPCNTAHAFADQLTENISVPLISIIEVTINYILDLGTGCIGLMATDGTLAARLYIEQLRARGIQVLVPQAGEQASLMQAIYAFKGGERESSTETAVSVYNQLKLKGAEAVIAGCTELPILLAGQSVIDPTQLLAKELVRLAG